METLTTNNVGRITQVNVVQTANSWPNQGLREKPDFIFRIGSTQTSLPGATRLVSVILAQDELLSHFRLSGNQHIKPLYREWTRTEVSERVSTPVQHQVVRVGVVMATRAISPFPCTNLLFTEYYFAGSSDSSQFVYT